MAHIFFLIIFSISNLFFIKGVHFLGGTISWRPLDASSTGSPVSIVITQTYTWTYGVVICTPTMIANNQYVMFQGAHTALDTTYLNCISNCPTNSPGYIAPLIKPYCTDISSFVGTIVGQRSDIVNLTVGDDFVVAFQAASWRALKQGTGAFWSISSHIDLKLRSNNGLYNNAPVATMMSPINIPVNETKVITIPVGDADGDNLRCRWATQANGINECGNVCPPNSLPPNTIIYPNCTIIITGELVGDWHAVTVIVEDFLDSSSNTSLSAVPVQFLVQVIAPPTCTTPPKVIGLPLENSCTSITIGQTYTSQLIAMNNCGSTVNISDIATLSFVGFVISELAMFNSTTFYKNITWIPTTNQLGYQLVCVMTIDSQNSQSSQYCFKFYVSSTSVCACPGYSCTTTTTSIASTTTAKPIDWPLIGTIIALTLLGALALSCCLCWYCLCPPGIFRWKLYHHNGLIELYHIESCIDPDCPWLSQKDIGSMINLCNNMLSKANRFDQKSSIIENHSTLNTNIKPLIHLPEENLVNKSIKTVQTSSIVKPRSQSFDDESQEICVNRKSAVNINFIRVIRAHSQLKVSDQYPNNDTSNIKNTIQLDDHSELSHRINSNSKKILVTRVQSNKNLSRIKNYSSQLIQNKRHIHRKLMQKISRPATAIIPFDSITKITKQEKTNENRITPYIIVKRLRKETLSHKD